MNTMVSLANQLGVYDSAVPNAVVAERIRQIVQNEYSQVSVETRDYEELRCRVVTVSMSRLNSRELNEARPGLIPNRVVCAVLGSMGQEDLTELHKAAQGQIGILIDIGLNRLCFHTKLQP